MIYVMECQTCGKSFIIDTKAHGRPRQYCSKKCATIEKYYSFIMNKLEKMDMTNEARTHWKSRLFRDRNLILKEGQ
ncbi:MAG: hypothetical protein JXR97_05480 [Planctomycetes bacterium]|nr:hypothetical protein [Planctomycetota bacterium]